MEDQNNLDFVEPTNINVMLQFNKLLISILIWLNIDYLTHQFIYKQI
jgi:hypothetical protein